MKNQNKIKKFLSITVISVVFSTLIASPVFASQITEDNLAYLINKERTYRGLSPLRISVNLDQAAEFKAEDMLNRNYFEHYAFGLAPWDFMKQANYNYLYAGENLAMDFQTAEGMVNAWMNSDLHRKNILNPDFEEMGIGVVKGEYAESGQIHDTIIVSNMFGRKKPAIVEVFNKIVDGFAKYLKSRSVNL